MSVTLCLSPPYPPPQDLNNLTKKPRVPVSSPFSSHMRSSSDRHKQQNCTCTRFPQTQAHRQVPGEVFLFLVERAYISCLTIQSHHRIIYVKNPSSSRLSIHYWISSDPIRSLPRQLLPSPRSRIQLSSTLLQSRSQSHPRHPQTIIQPSSSPPIYAPLPL